MLKYLRRRIIHSPTKWLCVLNNNVFYYIFFQLDTQIARSYYKEFELGGTELICSIHQEVFVFFLACKNLDTAGLGSKKQHNSIQDDIHSGILVCFKRDMDKASLFHVQNCVMSNICTSFEKIEPDSEILKSDTILQKRFSYRIVKQASLMHVRQSHHQKIM